MTKTTSKPHIRRSAIRWPGLAAFVVICALIAAFTWLLLDTILKWSFETTAGTLNGAEVNIASVEHSWSPLGVKITGVQVTDPAQPDMNRLVIGELTAQLNLEQLILGRLHIDNLVSSGIRTFQPRQSPGEVYAAPTKEDAQAWMKEGLASLNLALPSVDDIVARLELKTPEAIEQAQASLAQGKQTLAEVQEKLPTREQLAEYEQQLKALTESDIETPQQLAQKQEAFAALKKKFETDRARVAEAKTMAEQTLTQLKTDFDAVKSAPGEDLERAQQLMQLNSEGLSEITAVLFGEKMRQWSKYMLLAYEQLAPMLARSADEKLVKPQRGEGIWFEFSQAQEPPSFLIKKAQTEFAWKQTLLDVNWTNITHQHEQLGQPTTFVARASNSSLWQQLNLNGELALTAAGIDAKQQWQVQGIQLANLQLSEQSEFSATLLSSLLDSDGTVTLQDSVFDGGGTLRLSDMKVEAAAQNKWAAVVANALGQLNRLDINADIAGALTEPTFSFSSDLDRQLGGALKSAALDASRTELAGLRSQLQAQANGFLGENEDDLAAFESLLTDAESRDKKLQEMLKAKFEGAIEDKLKDKLKGVLGGN